MLWMMVQLGYAVVPYDTDVLLEKLGASQHLRQHRVLEKLPQIPASAYRSAATGQVITGLENVEHHAAQIGWGIGIFAVPIDHLYASINEELKHTELNGLAHTEILSGQPCSNGRKVLMVLPLPMISDRWWITTQLTNPKIKQVSNGVVVELAWIGDSSVKENALSLDNQARVAGKVRVTFTQGSWLLTKLDDKHTLGEYHSWVDPSGYLPAGPASRFANRSLVDVFAGMESYAMHTTQSECIEK